MKIIILLLISLFALTNATCNWSHDPLEYERQIFIKIKKITDNEFIKNVCNVAIQYIKQNEDYIDYLFDEKSKRLIKLMDSIANNKF